MLGNKLLLSSTFAFALGLVATSAQAQGAGGTQQQPSQQQPIQQQPTQPQQPQTFQPGMAGQQGYGQQGGALEQAPLRNAPVPQYWIADASLFISNAANAAVVLSREQALSVQEPSILGNQAQFLVEATQRSLDSLNELLNNAEATNPQAVPPIRIAIAELISAQSQAQAVVTAASQGVLGPTYEVTVRSALAHLQNAERAMNDIAGAYQAGGLGTINLRGRR